MNATTRLASGARRSYFHDTSVRTQRRIGSEVLLEGPHSRTHEALLLWRALRDFLRGFRVLHFVGPCVTIFGSARFGDPSLL